MRYVLDSSVAFKCCVKEPHSDKAMRFRADAWQGVHVLIVPEIFSHELAHALTKAERQKRLPVGDADLLRSIFMADPPHLVDTQGLIPRAIEIASFHRIGVYDCMYVALAEQEGCELITADDKLVRNLQNTFSFIVELSTLP